MSDITNLPQLDAMIAGLERLAKDPAVPTDRIIALFDLAERRERTIQRRVFNYDMNALQGEIGQIQKDRTNPAFHSRYATEEAIDRAARPIYTKYGFSIRYGTAPATVPGNIMVVCTVAHRDGYYEEHPLEGPVGTQGSQGGRIGTTPIQAVGATVTYLKRSLIRMVLNLVTADNPEDDDGETPRSHVQQPLPTYQAPQPPAAPQEANGDGNGIGRIAARLDRWEAECAGAQTKDEAYALLESDFAKASDARLSATAPGAYTRFDKARQAMIDRVIRTDDATV
jgi:hypothetical protein